ncbi:MAG: phosphoenolpyruvate--protein phosphotransferase [Micromonosporaceae bacterium]|nr:phosphoenolpyruvate--protein phosphotransferase [Micromonosporaceae bacterium]
MGCQLTGLGVSPGTVVGVVARLGAPPRPPADEVCGTNPAAELERVRSALAMVAGLLEERAATVPGAGGAILRATALMARDPGLDSAVRGLLEQGCPTARALDTAVESFCEALEGAGGYLAERAADLRDVRDRALAHLLDLPTPGIPHPGHPFVLVGRDLSPADTATLDPAEVLGIVTELGGQTSHTAILAKGLGIPAVLCCPGARDLADGEVVIVDGSTGGVMVDPDRAALAEARRLASARAAVRRRIAASASGPGQTADGHPVSLLVNVDGLDGALRAAAADSEGVGLFRTEALFLDRTTAPSVAEQAAAYARVLAAFAPRPVIARTLDAGADKPLAFVEHAREENPALGVRGYRMAASQPDLLDAQLAALARAAGDTGVEVRVMAPMVSVPAEAAAFREAAGRHGLRTAGVMVEVPAAALRAGDLLAEVDFVSIGTNDLAQYTFAADRACGELSDLLDPWQPALLDLVAAVGAAGRALGRPVGVCGEAASDPLLACVLVGLGVTSLSMAAGVLPEVRFALAAHQMRTCAEMARAARAARSAVAARDAARALADPEVLAMVR